MKIFLIVLVVLCFFSCDGTSNKEVGDGVEYKFEVGARYEFYRWEVVGDPKRFSRLANYVNNPIFLCVSDTDSKFYSGECINKSWGDLSVRALKYPEGTVVNYTGSGLLVESKGLDASLKGPQPLVYYRVLIGGEMLWLPEYYRDLLISSSK